MDKKRLLIALGFLVLCIVLGYFIYKFFFASTPPVITPTENPTSTSTFENFPEAGQGTGKTTKPSANTLPSSTTKPSDSTTQKPGQVTQILNDTINSVQKSGTNFHYYNVQDGKFYRMDENGNPVPMDDKVFFNVKKVTWAPEKEEGIIEYPDGSNIYYNFDTKKQVTLPKHWEEFSFSADSRKIAAKSIGISSDANWLVSASSDGTNVKLVEQMGENAKSVDVDWSPNQQILALARTGEALGDDEEEVLFVGENKQNFKSITVEGRGFNSEWSPTGKKLLYSVYSQRSDFKPELWVVASDSGTIGKDRKLLNINTWADKCTFNDDRFIFCGVPTKLETGAGFVPAIANNTPDEIYKIDTQTGIKTPIPLTEEHVIDSMFLGEDGKTLFFNDKNKAGLFRVSY